MERDKLKYEELQENAKRLTARLLPIYENQSEVDREYKNTKNAILNKLNDHNNTLTFRELIYTTNVNSEKKVAAIEKCIKVEQRKRNQKSIAFANHEYINQPTHIGNLVYVDRLENQYVELSTRYIDEQWEIVYKRVQQKKENYRAKFKQYRLVKSSFMKFVHYIEDWRRRLKQKRDFEKNKTHELHEQLKDCTYNSVNLENQILTLMNKLKTMEACYTLLTCLSPADWKKQFKDDQLINYELTRSDVDLTRNDHEHYLNHLYNRTLTGYLEDVRLRPVPNMYWESAEQFTRTLEKLEKKTTDKLMKFDMIKWRPSDSQQEENLRKRRKQKANAKFRKIVRKLNNRIKKNSADKEPSDFGYIKMVFHDEEYFRILKMMTDICRQLKHPYVDFNMPLTMFELISSSLDHVIIERNKIPNDQWERTGIILQMINKRLDETAKSKLIKCKVVQQTIQRETSKIYTEPTKRMEKNMFNRSKIPKQLPPEKQKKPALNYEQQLYLKCFTYLSPEDIDDDLIVTVPEFKFTDTGD